MNLEAFFERFKDQFQQHLPFVIYRKPNQKRLQGLLQHTASLFTTSDFSEMGFVFSPFDSRNKTILLPLKDSDHIYCDAFEEMASDLAQKKNDFQEPTNEALKKVHIDLIEKGKTFIELTDVKKIVLSRKEEVLLKDHDPFQIFTSLLTKYTSAFVYCWYHPEIGLWLGATPETLVKLEGNHFSIMALAGTQSYNGTLEVAWRDKELQEQQYVTDYIVDRIKASVENIQLSEVQTVKAANLLHLKTKIWGNLKNGIFSLKDFLFHLHPTPAVCGLPKEKAKQFILEHENYDRNFYTGFLGELNLESVRSPRRAKRNIEIRAYETTSTSTQLYVNLRCMSLEDSKAMIYVGGGITVFSNPEEEWEETVAKAKVIKSVL